MFEKLRMPIHEPLFLNEGTSVSELELRKLESIRGLVKEEDVERLERDICLTRAGIAGERKIVFELMNSHPWRLSMTSTCIMRELPRRSTFWS